MSVDVNFKYLLARIAFADPSRFLMTFAGADGTKYLRELWNGLQARARGDAHVPSDEFAVEFIGRLLILRLPPTSVPGSAIAVAVTGGENSLRIWVLEVAGPDADEPAVIREIEAEGGHTDGDPWARVDVESFAARVLELVAD